jgi:RimJ/RimL family protein N-acetyltransferase
VFTDRTEHQLDRQRSLCSAHAGQLPTGVGPRQGDVVQLEIVDPSDDGAFGAWYRTIAASYAHDWPHEPGWQPEELRAGALDTAAGDRVVLLAASDEASQRGAGQVMASASVTVHEHDNQHVAELTVDVDPAHRRRGAGSAILRAAEELAASQGRGLAIVEQSEPLRQLDRSPGKSFARRHGFACSQVSLRLDLHLPVDERRLEQLEEACTRYAGGYRIISWRDRCPEELLRDRAVLAERMSADIPLDELDRRPERWDLERVRATEALVAKQNRTSFSAGAVEDRSGRLVAYSDLRLPRGAPEKAYQWDTLVLAEHRGHRLGTLVKIANLRALASASPATHRVTTENAEDNSAMISVNQALGFEVVGRIYAWQKRIR